MWMVLVCSYHYFALSMFVADPVTRSLVGKNLIVSTLIVIVVNLSVLVFNNCRTLRDKANK
jgi:hypothetical protein